MTYIFRRLALGSRGGLAPSGVEVLARNSINPKQSLCLVKLGPRVLLLGLSPNQMTALHTIEDPDEVARRIGAAEEALGEGRVGWVHPDCGFWMLKRSVADRKMRSLVAGRDLYLGL